ncbi:MAG TPA: peptidyl-prolyl cis-trans isomerase, partial [Candidatus Limnocylindria bacterium]|nr:peptidyl-prolyl cis-trans isomerase [Candidatus Limnocylindria bacterium]
PARDAPAGMGDGFLAGRELAGSERELSRVFGPAFVAELARLPLGRWSGPLASPYGWHVVRVDERTSETLPPVAAVRARLVEAVRAEQAAERLARRLAELRARDRAGRS